MNVKSAFLQQPKIFAKYLASFCKQLCSKELSKIAQSGHTARNLQKAQKHFCKNFKCN